MQGKTNNTKKMVEFFFKETEAKITKREKESEK